MKTLTLIALILAGCGGGNANVPAPPPLPPRGPVMVNDPMAYLAQSVRPDGNPATPLHATDPLGYRRTDIGGYQIEDTFLIADNAAITTFAYPPFGTFNPANGDGGERMVFDGTSARIDATQDGSAPGVMPFDGPDGWLLFRTDATGSNTCVVATLGIAQSYTCYSVQTVNYPGLGPVMSVVTDHYNTGDLSRATAMERIFLGRGWGRLVWQAWNSAAVPTRSPELDQRCPDFGWSAPPKAGWVLNDCRIVTTIIGADGNLTGAQEWHP